MESNTFIAFLHQSAAHLGFTVLSVVMAVFGLFRWLGTKWLENKFAESLQSLKSEQEQVIRLVQSTIDRQVHRAKKLYDNEFTSLTESWRLLRAAYDLSSSTFASFTTRVDQMNHEELERHLSKIGMEEWQRNELRSLTGVDRQDEYWKWSEWQKAVECYKRWRECQQQIDATSIFFPEGFTEKFRKINDMIFESNNEYEFRIRQYKSSKHGGGFDSCESNERLRKEGKLLIVASRMIVWAFYKQMRMRSVPVFHRPHRGFALECRLG